MLLRLTIFCTLSMLAIVPALSQQAAVKSNGYLSFQCNGILYTADTTHARGYAVKQTGTAFLSAANSQNMVINMQWEKLTGPGTYLITKAAGKAEFTINHKTFFLKQSEDYVKVIISSIKQQGPFLLLKGTFEGQLYDKNGNRINITHGKFETIHL